MLIESSRRFSWPAGRRLKSASLPVVAFLLLSLNVVWPQTATSSAAGHSVKPADTADANDLNHARQLLGTPQFLQAEEIVDRYLDQHPDHADAHALKGLLLYRQHQPRASMAEYLRASQSGDLSAFDLRIFALDCAAIPDLPEAKKWLQRSLEKDDHDAATWEALGHVRFASQEYKSAIEALNRALQISPRTVSAEALIGLANERFAQLDAAEAAYRKAIQWEAESKDNDPVPYVGLGRVMLVDNRLGDAIPLLQKAVQMPQASSEAHELLGQSYAKTGRNAEAVKELETAIDMDPKSARLHFMLGNVYHGLGETEKANAELKKYVRLREGSAQ
jgi:tetratricopeptide (TPR) repeat protein